MSSADPTVRLIVGRAVSRFLAAPRTERAGVTQRAIPAIFGIFGHGNVLWDLGVPVEAAEPEVAALAAAYVVRAEHQRFCV